MRAHDVWAIQYDRAFRSAVTVGLIYGKMTEFMGAKYGLSVRKCTHAAVRQLWKLTAPEAN